MRTVIIAISILVIVSFVLEDGYGQMPPGFGMPPGMQPGMPPGYKPPGEQQQQRKLRRGREKVKPADPNVVIDPNMPTDPNVILEKIQEFKGLDRDIKQVTDQARAESRAWTRPNKDNSNLDLANAVNDQVTEEFKFIRELAAEEGAAMTVAAIDGLMLERQERFEEVTKKLEQNLERTRKKAEREERRRGGSDRGGRRDRDSRRRDRTRRTTPGTQPGMGMPPGM
ncbi:MAG: hypothetical protein ACYS18_07725 [Planctomycetota bacterium]